MTLQEQQDFITNLYQDLFSNADVSKISSYCAANFIEENNYDILDYQTFTKHVESLADEDVKVHFDIDFLVNVPGKVVIRTVVSQDQQIAGAPPISLLISYWQFNDQGLVDYCKEVEYAG